MSQLGIALFTRTQRQVLGLIYSRPERSFYTNEILRSTGMGVATIKRELDRMEAAGILTSWRQGNQRHYQANSTCPIYHELRGIVRKSFGVKDALVQALDGLADRIHSAFVFGSFASGTETAASDIDLMLVGQISFSEAVTALHPAQESLAREINPRVYSCEEWSRLLREPDAFIRDVMSKSKLHVIGESGEP